MRLKNVAFTLAEVLIVIGIIGIIADMTIPTLVQNYQEKVTVVKLKKIYTVFSQATRMIEIENGEIAGWPWGNYPDATAALNIMNLYAEHLNIMKNCGLNAGEGCFAKGVTYRYLNGNDKDILDNRVFWSKAVLADGAAFGFVSEKVNCGEIYGNLNVCGTLYVDLNGEKKPNVWGKDFFEFYIASNGVYPKGRDDTEAETSNAFSSCNLSSGTKTGYGCSAWVLYKENLDYLHCDDLSWNGKSKCD